jgi:extracellular factor (EF) 3-hydroxypalmitic acid methyl ester biosynthesis protein
MTNQRTTLLPTDTTPKSYEDLDGAQGREVFFRPNRYRPANFPGMMVEVRVRSKDGEHSCIVLDVSQSGVAFVWPDGLNRPLAHDHIESLAVTFDKHVAYQGAASIVTTRLTDDVYAVGASFSDALLDIDKVLHLRDVKAWESERAPSLRRDHKPWATDGHHAFKSLVGEFRLYLEDASHEFASTEASLPWKVVHGQTDAPARKALIHTLREGFVKDVARFSAEADAALRTAEPSMYDALRTYSRQMLDSLLMQAPVIYRARTKPLGYPGDFEVMRFAYEDHFEGPSLYAKALHLAAVLLPGPSCVPSRKEAIKAAIAARISRMSPESTLRVASIASGPAQEVYELLSELPSIPGSVHIVLYDQDPTALSFAFSRLSKLADVRWAGKVKIRFLHDSIKRLLRDPELFRDHAPFDLVICAGLFDYLDDEKARVLTQALYKSLRGGGTLYWGNFVPEQPTRWLLEHHLEWFLTYRSREQMRAIATEAVPKGVVSVLEESVGWCPFVALTHV